MRTCRLFKESSPIRTLYGTLILTKLDHASVIRSHHIKKYIQSIQNCQRRFLKFLVWKEIVDIPVVILIVTVLATDLEFGVWRTDSSIQIFYYKIPETVKERMSWCEKRIKMDIFKNITFLALLLKLKIL